MSARAPVRPPRLRPGDSVAIVAPAGPVPREAFAAGVRILEQRYKLHYDEGVFARDSGFLAGSDERRAAELNAALHNPAMRAIFCARGGYGLTRILPAIDFEALVRDPRPIVGFSDVTALHAGCARAGIVSLHGPVITQLGRLATLDPSLTEDYFARLESADPTPVWSRLMPVAPGLGEGISVGGNLEVFTRLVGTPWLPPLAIGEHKAVLFLEEVGERPYRIDRQLTHLALAGVLERVAAIVVGHLHLCEEKDGTSDPWEVIHERLGGLGVPVVAGAPFGHGDDNRPFPLGARVRVDGDAGQVMFLDGAVT